MVRKFIAELFTISNLLQLLSFIGFLLAVKYYYQTGMEIFLIAPFLVCYCMKVRHDYHMFQLNSYKTIVYARWLLHNYIKNCKILRDTAGFFVPLLFAIHMGGQFRINELRVWGIFLIVWCATVDTYYWPQEAEKPLVYTPRLLRMFATHSVIMVLTLAWLLPINDYWKILFLVLFVVLAPLSVLLVNFINSPFEWDISS